MKRTTTAIVWLTSLSVIAITLAFLWWAQSGRFEGASNSRQLAGVHPIRAWQGVLEQMGSTGHQNVALGFTGSGNTSTFTHFNLPLRSIAVFLLWLTAVLGVGYVACRRCLDELFPAEKGLLTFAIGFVALGLLVLAIGLVGLARPTPIWIVIIVAALACVPFGKEVRAAAADMLPRFRVNPQPGAAGDTASPQTRVGVGSVLLTMCIVIVFVGAGLFALTPPLQSDAMRYHLAAPQEYLKLGKISYLPHNAFSNFPFLLEMHFLIALGLGAPEASQLMHMALLAASALGVWCFWRRFFSRQTSNAGLLWSLAAYSAIPASLLVSAWPFNDQAVAFFFFMSVYAALLAGNLNRTSYYAVAGIMAGGALGTKYTALPFIGILGVLWAADLLITEECEKCCPHRSVCCRPCGGGVGPCAKTARSEQQPQSNRPEAWRCSCHAHAVRWPLVLKNILLTRNPVYPAANELFRGGDWTIENAVGLSAKMHEKGTAATPLNLLLSPIHINTRGHRGTRITSSGLFFQLSCWGVSRPGNRAFLTPLAPSSSIPGVHGPGILRFLVSLLSEQSDVASVRTAVAAWGAGMSPLGSRAFSISGIGAQRCCIRCMCTRLGLVDRMDLLRLAPVGPGVPDRHHLAPAIPCT